MEECGVVTMDEREDGDVGCEPWSLLYLSDDLLLILLTWLRPPDIRNLGLTCVTMYELCRDDVLWCSMVRHAWGIPRPGSLISAEEGTTSWYHVQRRLVDVRCRVSHDGIGAHLTAETHGDRGVSVVKATRLYGDHVARGDRVWFVRHPGLPRRLFVPPAALELGPAPILTLEAFLPEVEARWGRRWGAEGEEEEEDEGDEVEVEEGHTHEDHREDRGAGGRGAEGGGDAPVVRPIVILDDDGEDDDDDDVNDDVDGEAARRFASVTSHEAQASALQRAHFMHGSSLDQCCWRPVLRTSLYFEVTVVSNPDANPEVVASGLNEVGMEQCVTVGFGKDTFPTHGNHPGWMRDSVGYHSDDGALFWDGVHQPYGPTWGLGDTVGAGFRLEDRRVFFTLNGLALGFGPRLTTPSFVPIIGVDSAHGVSVNFGHRPFVYNFQHEPIRAPLHFRQQPALVPHVPLWQAIAQAPLPAEVQRGVRQWLEGDDSDDSDFEP